METTSKSYGQLGAALLAIAIGLLFIIWPDNVIGWAVWFIGILSLSVGVLRIITYFSIRRELRRYRRGLPLVGIIAIIWGILLLAQPEVWVNLFMIVLSFPMILLAISQIAWFVRKKRTGFVVKWTYYVFPVLYLLAGITVILNPFASALWLVIFVGAWTIAYGIVEMINFFFIKN